MVLQPVRLLFREQFSPFGRAVTSAMRAQYGAPRPRGASCVGHSEREEKKERKGEKWELSPGIGHAHSTTLTSFFATFFGFLFVTFCFRPFCFFSLSLFYASFWSPLFSFCSIFFDLSDRPVVRIIVIRTGNICFCEPQQKTTKWETHIFGSFWEAFWEPEGRLGFRRFFSPFFKAFGALFTLMRPTSARKYAFRFFLI